MNNITKLNISDFINTKFRDYALYVISSRGIPSFYDALTPVQRYILMNAPSSFNKTLTLVGSCISSGYHHSDMSLQGAIAKLARPFGSALQILEGYGFFGSEVCPDPAAARYTSIKLSPKANDIIKKYNFLTTRDEDGAFHPLWMDIPIGLTTPITGIAVGYKSIILPRKLEDIQKYLNGEIKSLKPYFINFKGNIQKYNNNKNSWLISSNIVVKDNRIEIREIPPILKYSSAIKRLDWLFNHYEGNIKLLNNSNTKVNVDIIYIGKNKEEFNEIVKFCQSVFSIIVTESVIFVKDDQILVYDSVEQYLDDYKWQIKRLAFNKSNYDVNYLNKELEFNKTKQTFINFILTKKREVLEIDEFLKTFDNNIKDRLERLTSKKFTKNELLETSETIKKISKELKDKILELKHNKSEFDKLKDPTLKKGLLSQKSNNLFEISDMPEINDIIVWDGRDVIEEFVETPNNDDE